MKRRLLEGLSFQMKKSKLFWSWQFLPVFFFWPYASERLRSTTAILKPWHDKFENEGAFQRCGWSIREVLALWWLSWMPEPTWAVTNLCTYHCIRDNSWYLRYCIWGSYYFSHVCVWLIYPLFNYFYPAKLLV